MKGLKKKAVSALERKPIAPTVVIRPSTPEQRRQQEEAFNVLLAELVRQRLGRKNNV